MRSNIEWADLGSTGMPGKRWCFSGPLLPESGGYSLVEVADFKSLCLRSHSNSLKFSRGLASRKCTTALTTYRTEVPQQHKRELISKISSEHANVFFNEHNTPMRGKVEQWESSD